MGVGNWDDLIEESSARHGVDPNLIRAMMHQESGGNRGAVSPKGATGLMQLMPATARRFGVTDIRDPRQNIEGGVKYVKWLSDRFHGDTKLVLAGYNAGEGAVDKHGGVPPYAETRNYVKSIMARYGGGSPARGSSSTWTPPQPIRVRREEAEPEPKKPAGVPGSTWDPGALPGGSALAEKTPKRDLDIRLERRPSTGRSSGFKGSHGWQGERKSEPSIGEKALSAFRAGPGKKRDMVGEYTRMGRALLGQDNLDPREYRERQGEARAPGGGTSGRGSMDPREYREREQARSGDRYDYIERERRTEREKRLANVNANAQANVKPGISTRSVFRKPSNFAEDNETAAAAKLGQISLERRDNLRTTRVQSRDETGYVPNLSTPTRYEPARGAERQGGRGSQGFLTEGANEGYFSPFVPKDQQERPRFTIASDQERIALGRMKAPEGYYAGQERRNPQVPETRTAEEARTTGFDPYQAAIDLGISRPENVPLDEQTRQRMSEGEEYRFQQSPLGRMQRAAARGIFPLAAGAELFQDGLSIGGHQVVDGLRQRYNRPEFQQSLDKLGAAENPVRGVFAAGEQAMGGLSMQYLQPDASLPPVAANPNKPYNWAVDIGAHAGRAGFEAPLQLATMMGGGALLGRLAPGLAGPAATGIRGLAGRSLTGATTLGGYELASDQPGGMPYRETLGERGQRGLEAAATGALFPLVDVPVSRLARPVVRRAEGLIARRAPALEGLAIPGRAESALTMATTSAGMNAVLGRKQDVGQIVEGAINAAVFGPELNRFRADRQVPVGLARGETVSFARGDRDPETGRFVPDGRLQTAIVVRDKASGLTLVDNYGRKREFSVEEMAERQLRGPDHPQTQAALEAKAREGIAGAEAPSAPAPTKRLQRKVRQQQARAASVEAGLREAPEPTTVPKPRRTLTRESKEAWLARRRGEVPAEEAPAPKTEDVAPAPTTADRVKTLRARAEARKKAAKEFEIVETEATPAKAPAEKPTTPEKTPVHPRTTEYVEAFSKGKTKVEDGSTFVGKTGKRAYDAGVRDPETIGQILHVAQQAADGRIDAAEMTAKVREITSGATRTAKPTVADIVAPTKKPVEAPESTAQKSYDDYQRDIDKMETELEQQGVDVVKTPLKDLPKKLQDLYDARDAVGKANDEAGVAAISSKLESVVPDAAKRTKLARIIGQADVMPALRAKGNWRDAGEVANQVLQFVRNDTGDPGAFTVDAVLGGPADAIGTQLRLTIERGLGPRPETLRQAQAILDQLYGADAPKLPGATPDKPGTQPGAEGQTQPDTSVTSKPDSSEAEAVSADDSTPPIYTKEQVDAYRPSRAVRQGEKGWTYQTIDGKQSGESFRTKKQAGQAAAKHKTEAQAALKAKPAAKPTTPVTEKRGPGRVSDEEWNAMSDEEKNAHRKALEDAVDTDALTGIGNRRAYNRRVAEMEAEGGEIHTTLIDGNGMGGLNDTAGYALGDAVIKATAEALRGQGLTVFRYGGDEFVILHRGNEGVQEAVDRADADLRSRVVDAIHKDGTELTVTNLSFSFGTGKGKTGDKAWGKANVELSKHKKQLEEEGIDRAAKGTVPPGVRIRVSGDAEPGRDSAGVGEGQTTPEVTRSVEDIQRDLDDAEKRYYEAQDAYETARSGALVAGGGRSFKPTEEVHLATRKMKQIETEIRELEVELEHAADAAPEPAAPPEAPEVTKARETRQKAQDFIAEIDVRLKEVDKSLAKRKRGSKMYIAESERAAGMQAKRAEYQAQIEEANRIILRAELDPKIAAADGLYERGKLQIQHPDENIRELGYESLRLVAATEARNHHGVGDDFPGRDALFNEAIHLLDAPHLRPKQEGDRPFQREIEAALALRNAEADTQKAHQTAEEVRKAEAKRKEAEEKQRAKEEAELRKDLSPVPAEHAEALSKMSAREYEAYSERLYREGDYFNGDVTPTMKKNGVENGWIDSANRVTAKGAEFAKSAFRDANTKAQGKPIAERTADPKVKALGLVPAGGQVDGAKWHTNGHGAWRGEAPKGSTYTAETRYTDPDRPANVGAIIKGLPKNMVEVKPVAVQTHPDIDRLTDPPKVGPPRRLIQDQIIFNNGVVLDGRLYDYTLKAFGDDVVWRAHPTDNTKPVTAHKGDEIVAVIMPMRADLGEVSRSLVDTPAAKQGKATGQASPIRMLFPDTGPSPSQTPPATRESLLKAATEIYGAEGAAELVGVVAQRAAAWSKINNRPASEYYARRIAELASVEGGEAKASITFLKDGRAIIRAFQNSTVADAVHELFHMFRRDLAGNALRIAERWAGVKDGNWTVAAEEKFVRAFERYRKDQTAPDTGMRRVFSDLATWLKDVYSSVRGLPTTKDMKNVFDSLLDADAAISMRDRIAIREAELLDRIAVRDGRMSPRAEGPTTLFKLPPYAQWRRKKPEVPKEKMAKVPQKPTLKARKKALANIDKVRKYVEHPLQSAATWARFHVAMGADWIPSLPVRAMDYVNDHRKLARLLRGSPLERATRAAQMAKAAAGMASGEKWMHHWAGVDAEGNPVARVQPHQTAKLFLWGILSRGASPFPHENAFINASTKGIDRWVNDALTGKFDIDKYHEWVSDKSTGPLHGTEGAGVIHNLGAYGDWLRKMSEVVPEGEDGAGKTKLQALHDWMSDVSLSGRQIRRRYNTLVEGSGIDNKVVSFILLATGRTDVLVLDRVQLNHLWGAEDQFPGLNAYQELPSGTLTGKGAKNAPPFLVKMAERVSRPGSTPADAVRLRDAVTKYNRGVPKSERITLGGTGLYEIADGTRGIALYEALEDALAVAGKKAYEAVGRGDEFSLGRMHWDTWVIRSKQEVDHGSLPNLMREVRGEAEPYLGATVEEGKYGLYKTGVQTIYGGTKRGTFYVARTSDGRPFVVDNVPFDRWQKALVKAGKDGEFTNRNPKKDGPFQVSEQTGAWHREERNAGVYDKLLREFGRRPTPDESRLIRRANGPGQPRGTDRAGSTGDAGRRGGVAARLRAGADEGFARVAVRQTMATRASRRFGKKQQAGETTIIADLADLVDLAEITIRNGAADFADWSAKYTAKLTGSLGDDYTERVQPYLKDIYEQARNRGVAEQRQAERRVNNQAQKPPRIDVDPLNDGKPARKPVDIIGDLARGVNRRVRVSKSKGPRVLGMYYPGSARINLRYAQDLDTAAHEFVHALDDAYGVVAEWAYDTEPSPYDDELIPHFSQHGSEPPSNIDDARALTYTRAEGVAEFGRAWAVNPAAARAAAPEFAKYWESNVPEPVLAVFRKFGDDVRRHDAATNIKKVVLGTRMKMKTETMLDKLLGPMGKRGDVFRTRFLDRMHPVWKSLETLEKEFGRALTPDTDPRYLFSAFLGVDTKLETIFEHGMVDTEGNFVTKGVMEEIYGPLDKTSMDTIQADLDHVVSLGLSELVVERHARELDQRMQTIDSAKQAAVDRLDSDHDRLREENQVDKLRISQRYDDALELYKERIETQYQYRSGLRTGKSEGAAGVKAKRAMSEGRLKAANNIIAAAERRLIKAEGREYTRQTRDVQNIEDLINERKRRAFENLDARLERRIQREQTALDERFERARVRSAERLDIRYSRVTGVAAGSKPGDLNVHRGVLKEFDNLPPEQQARVRASLDGLRRWSRATLEYAAAKGIISPEAFSAMSSMSDYYIAMQRVMDEAEALGTVNKPARSSRNVAAASKVYHRWHGSTREIENPIVATLQQTAHIIREADRNEFVRSFADALIAPREMYMGKVNPYDLIGSKGSAGDKNVTKVIRNGKIEYWNFDEDVLRALRGLNDLTTWPKLATYPGQLLRMGVTFAPPFIVRNMIRDTVNRSIISEHGGKPWDILPVIGQGYTKEDLIEARIAGLGQFGHYAQGREAWHKFLSDQMHHISKDRNFLLMSAKDIGRFLKRGSEKSEMIGRMAEYKRAKKAGLARGMTESEARMYAVKHSRELLDFAVAGDWVHQVNQIIPFTNAAVQGLRRTARTAKEHPGAFMAKSLAYAIIPTIGNLLFNATQGEETLEEYLSLPAYQRDMFWNFKLPEGSPWRWLSIPKPFEVGVLATGLERMIASAYFEDKHAYDGWWQSAVKALVPVDVDAALAIPLVRPTVETRTNYDMFRDENVIPTWEQTKDVDLREGTPRATRVGRTVQAATGLFMKGASQVPLLGDVMEAAGLFPINGDSLEAARFDLVDGRKIDHWLAGTFGTSGRLALQASDVIIPREDKPEAGSKFAGTMVGLIKDAPGYNARDVKYVLERAEGRGEERAPDVRELRDILKKASNAETNEEKYELLRKARAKADRMRDKFDQTGSFK